MIRLAMTRRLLPALALLLVSTAAMAEDRCRGPDGLEPARVALPAVNGEFRWIAEKGLGCAVDEEAALAMARNERPLTYLPCLRIGGIGVSDTVSQVEDILGPPARILPLGDATESRAYFIPQRGGQRPYFAVTYRRGEAVAVQLIGPPTRMPFAFSSLRLGDSPDRVIAVLGLPARRCPGPRGAETWLWPPFPIGVDVKDGAVTAMKVSWPR